MASEKAPSVAYDISTINNPADWPGYSLPVQLHGSVHRSDDGSRRGFIRAFDLSSVFIVGRKMEHFASVEDLVKVWGVVRMSKSR